MLYIDFQPGQTCHSKDGGSCIFRWRGRAWLTIWNRVKSHGTVTNWCTGRGWPVNCLTVISARWWLKHAIPKTAEVTHSVGHLWEEIAGAWRRVHISAWKFDGKYKADELNGRQRKIPLFTQACPVVAPCAFSRPSSTYIEESRPHRRTILIPLLIAPTSHKRPSRK